jgi:signal transduction histidine kinase/FixJ family two-component response regulator
MVGAERARVLVVDDDDRNLIAIRTVIEDVADVVVARSGEEALRQLLRGDFAVILLDVYMPGMDGYETAQLIRGREQTKRIPIVFLSAVNKEMKHLMRGYSMGAVDYVFKPVEPSILRSKVAVFVDLFHMRCEIQRKAQHEQLLLDASLRANAERLRAEQELRLVEQRQAAIIDSLPIVLYLADPGAEPSAPRFVSKNFSSVTGFDAAVFRNQPALWMEQVHPDDRARVQTAMASRASGADLSVEYRWRGADGAYRHFIEQAVLLRDADGLPIEYAGTLLDVSLRKELEVELAHARKMDAIGQLTGGIAHDFNNLLGAVLGGLGLIERRIPLDDEQRRILGMTRHAAEQGADLVRRLLAFARRQTLEPTAIEVAALWASIGDLLEHTLGGLVQLDWISEATVGRIFADRGQLQLAIMNLIINARDAMPDGGSITVAAAETAIAAGQDARLKPGRYVRITVADTGTGIAAADLEKVLEPFYSTKEVGKGTGLGLSMVYGFVQQSGGAIRIDSVVGAGTCVEMLLPAVDGDDDLIDAPAPVAAAPIRSAGIAGRLLLVDDHEGLRATTAALLEDLGYEVHQAHDALAALALLERADLCIDLIVTDYAMPRISGGDLIERARVMRPGIPAVIVTGYADADQIARKPQHVAIVAKPFDAHDLSDALENALRAALPKVAVEQ